MADKITKRSIRYKQRSKLKGTTVEQTLIAQFEAGDNQQGHKRQGHKRGPKGTTLLLFDKSINLVVGPGDLVTIRMGHDAGYR